MISGMNLNRLSYGRTNVYKSARLFLLALAVGLNFPAAVAQRTSDAPMPHLEGSGATTSLVVDGAPFFIRGGELGNSSASQRDYMRERWQTLVELGLNTVLVPIEWDLLEPQEGRFDFTLVDGLLEDAREHNLRLVLLWFGTWKNSMSCYAPGWVKRDTARFPRCRTAAGQPLEIVTPFSETAAAADARAFTALMQHLRKVDAENRTAIMVQVENEIGMIPEARDHSAAADAAFAAEVPAALITALKANRDRLAPALREAWEAQGAPEKGSWEACFGAGAATDELFMAWHFARYADLVAAAGKAVYPLPMYVNAALVRPGATPGAYPSAGPLPHLVDVWRAAAPHIDFIAPDIYFQNFVEWTDMFAVANWPSFIPEAQISPQNAANALYAVGKHGAIGFSPFSIESIETPAGHPLQESYQLLVELEPLIAEHRGQSTMTGVAPRIPFDERDIPKTESVELGGYAMTITFERFDMWSPPPKADERPAPSGGLIIATGPDEFLIAGTGLVVTFPVAKESPRQIGIESAEEGRFVDGQWTADRRLNGDQTHQGRHIRIPVGAWVMQKFKLYRYE
jgi:hypothetical protein